MTDYKKYKVKKGHFIDWCRKTQIGTPNDKLNFSGEGDWGPENPMACVRTNRLSEFLTVTVALWKDGKIYVNSQGKGYAAFRNMVANREIQPLLDHEVLAVIESN